ncbi:endospore germination permease [Paenibacillus chartarius]|uniref:Endospore germination permease n=1 Tax=Paenibacillus chartarius TaxID=747481 RepID=A0ABV6DP79_9BACL
MPNNISVFQVCSILLLSVGILNHVILIPVLLDAAGRDAVVAVGMVLALLPVWAACLTYIMKHKDQQPFRDWLQRHFGKGLSVIILAAVSVYIWLQGFVSFFDIIVWAHSTYMPHTPRFALALLALACCLFLATGGLRSIAIVSGILLPFVVLLGFFVAAFNFKHKDYSLVLPLLADGFAPVWRGSLFAASALFELVLLLFLQHRLTHRPSFADVLLMIFLLAGLTIGPLMGAISIFGIEEAVLQRYPAFEQWRVLELGKYIEHLDVFAIYQWISGVFVRLSLSLFIMADVWNAKNRRPFLLLAAGTMLLASIAPISDVRFLQFLKTVYFPFTFLLVIGLTFLFAGKTWISRWGMKGQT